MQYIRDRSLSKVVLYVRIYVSREFYFHVHFPFSFSILYYVYIISIILSYICEYMHQVLWVSDRICIPNSEKKVII